MFLLSGIYDAGYFAARIKQIARYSFID